MVSTDLYRSLWGESQLSRPAGLDPVAVLQMDRLSDRYAAIAVEEAVSVQRPIYACIETMSR